MSFSFGGSRNRTRSTTGSSQNETGAQTGRQTGFSRTDPYGPAQGLLDSVIRSGRGLYEDAGARQFFPQNLVTPFAPQTQSAFQGYTRAAHGANPVVQAAANTTTGLLDGSNPYLSQIGSNPFRQEVKNQGFRNIGDAFRRDFAGLGLTGSTGHQRELGRALSDYGGRFDSSAYDTDQGNMLLAANLQHMAAQNAPNVAAAQGIPAGFLGTVGNAIERRNQAVIDAEKERHDYERDAPWMRWGQMLQGLGPVAEAFGTRESEQENIVDYLRQLTGESRSEGTNRGLQFGLGANWGGEGMFGGRLLPLST